MKSTIDKLFYNGTMYTLASEGDTVESLGVSAGKIVHAGSKNLAEMNYDIKEYVDLDGQILLPSVADSHLHFYAYCQTLTTVDLGGCTTQIEAMERLSK